MGAPHSPPRSSSASRRSPSPTWMDRHSRGPQRAVANAEPLIFERSASSSSRDAAWHFQQPRNGKSPDDSREFGQSGSLIEVSGGQGSVPCFPTMQPPLCPGGEPELRLLDRHACFGQSTGRFHVKRMLRNEMVRILRYGDFFHTVVHNSTVKIIVFFCMTYTCTHIFYSFIYWIISDPCHFEIESWLDAFFLSVQVGMTIGWGLPGHPYLKKDLREKHGCYSGAVTILIHTLTMHVLNALLIGVLYCRVSRGTKRSSSIAFTDRAVIRELNGKLYFMFQVCELRKHQLTEAHVRCYALIAPPSDREASDGVAVNVRQCAMRLSHPNDELGGMLLLALPSIVVHEIDAWSPFAQSPGIDQNDFSGLVRRAVDIGPDGLPSAEQRKPPSREDVESFLQSSWIEVVCLVEGIEPTTSATIQARHSYANEDLVFDHGFAPAVSRHRAGGGSWVVDFDRFHSLVPMPPKDAVGLETLMPPMTMTEVERQ